MGNIYLIISISFILWGIVIGKTHSECLLYDFESDLEEFKHDAPLCEPFPLWTVGNYSEIGIESPIGGSESYISPSLALSCISSVTFEVSGGVVEINVYMDRLSPSDVLQALLMVSSSGGNDTTAATITLTPFFTDVNGWQKLLLEVPTNFGDFTGYVTFLGLKSVNSIFLLDSFRYVPETVDKNTCLIYEDETDTTLDAYEPTTENPNGENDIGQDDGQCLTYNFEKDFDVIFTVDNYLCEGFLSWNINNYTSGSVKSPDAKSTLFISPSEDMSCVSSFVFRMEPNGVIEANIYMEPISELDFIILIAQKVTSEEVDTVAGFTMYYPENRQFVSGWNVLSFPVLDFTSFDGYLIFLGSATEGSDVLVDAVRYIPPSTASADESCSIY